MTARHIQHAVILAAGKGQRLAAINEDRPKALFPVNGRPLLDFACEFAEAIGSRERIIVGGFCFPALDAYVSRTARSGLRLLQVEDFSAGNVMSLLAALPCLHGTTLIMNVDHIYSTPLRSHVASPRDDVTIFCDRGRPLIADDMKVSLDARGRVCAIAKTLTHYDCGYIGMTYVPAAHLDTYRAMALATYAREGRDASVERVIQGLARDGHDVCVSDIGAHPWAEIDTPTDYDSLHQRTDLLA